MHHSWQQIRRLTLSDSKREQTSTSLFSFILEKEHSD